MRRWAYLAALDCSTQYKAQGAQICFISAGGTDIRITFDIAINLLHNLSMLLFRRIRCVSGCILQVQCIMEEYTGSSELGHLTQGNHRYSLTSFLTLSPPFWAENIFMSPLFVYDVCLQSIKPALYSFKDIHNKQLNTSSATCSTTEIYENKHIRRYVTLIFPLTVKRLLESLVSAGHNKYDLMSRCYLERFLPRMNWQRCTSKAMLHQKCRSDIGFVTTVSALQTTEVRWELMPSLLKFLYSMLCNSDVP